MQKAFLALADGTVFEGESLGVSGEIIGEIVFSTGMTGYLESITDPAYAGQILTMTYPLIGNYGVNREDCQSSRVQAKGLIMKELADFPNNFRCQETLKDYLISEGVVAIGGIDTRALTKIIRTHGSMNGMIITADSFNFAEFADKIRAYKVGYMLDDVTVMEKKTYGEGLLKVALLDYGAKKSLIHSFTSRGASVTVYPASTKAEEILKDKPDGIVLSGGPGNPENCKEQIAELKKLCGFGIPTFAVELGHQLLALAMGGVTEKLSFGHRGANQPVKDLALDQTFMSSQNHGYAVVEGSLPAEVAKVSHINVNDGTVEGIRYLSMPAISVQFNPESKPGAKSAKYLLEEFMEMMGGKANA